MEIESREKVRKLLRELFQFDTQDLDFGIYRVMNFKRDAIEKFIEKDLLEAAEAEFREYAKVGLDDLQRDVERLNVEINRDFGAGTIDEQRRVVRHRDAPKVQQYLSKLKELESAQITQAQIDDVFNHIYEFFSRYYDRGDFLSKRRYGGREKYYVPYNGEETLLHWATADQYYVKTGEYFKRYSFKAGGWRVNFVLKEAEVDPNSVKGGNRYFLLNEGDILSLDEASRELDIHFVYRELTDDEEKRYGRGNIQDRITSEIADELFSKIGNKVILRELRNKPVIGDVTLFEQHVRRFVTRNTTDYFIHKNLKAFLEGELEFYLKNEVLDLDEIEQMDERNIRLNKAKIQAIRRIGNRIIDFLAQIEDFQKKLFEKKKFVLKTDYCITLECVPEDLYEEIGQNEQQVAEWKKLFRLDETTKNTLQSTAGKKTLDPKFLRSHKFLVLDTKFFSQDFKDRLLERFKDLDESVGGIMVKSENWQALNLLQERFRNDVKCIYIDPPYNTGSDEFIYKDNYQHSSWLSMMVDRLALGRTLLQEDGALFVSISDEETDRLQLTVDAVFGEHNHRNTIIVRRYDKNLNRQFMGSGLKSLNVGAEFILAYAKSDAHIFNPIIREASVQRMTSGYWKGFWNSADRPTMRYELLGVNPTYGQWKWEKEKAMEAVRDYQEYLKRYAKDMTLEDYWEKTGRAKKFIRRNPEGKGVNQGVEHWIPPAAGILRNTNWNDILASESLSYMGLSYDNPKSVQLIEQIMQFGADQNDLILDFFAGSGTTAHAVLNLNQEDSGQRKYILVEMAEYFDTVLIPRIEKIMYSREWKNGLPVSNEGRSHMFKYMYLEQYEDTLNNIVFRSLDKTVQETLDSFQDYFVRYMLDYETRDSPSRLVLEKFRTPFDYKIKIIKPEEKEEIVSVDLVETFNYLLGLSVEKLRVFKGGERTYRVVFGKKENDKIVVIWRNTKDLDLERDKRFVEEAILVGNKPNTIYINGDSYLENAQPIEPAFKRLMGA